MSRPAPASSTSVVAVIVTLAVTLGLIAVAAWLLRSTGTLGLEPSATTLALVGGASIVLAWSAVQLAHRNPDRTSFDAIRHGMGIAAVIIVVDALFGTTAVGLEGALRALSVLIGIPIVELVAQRFARGGSR